MTTLRIVEVENNRFAVQKRTGLILFHWDFLCSSGDGYVWRDNDTIYRHALVASEEGAEKVLERTAERFMRKHNKPKVVRIVKTVRV